MADRMTFLLASTFTDSLARLNGDEQKQAKTTAFDLQVNPANPGHSFHKLDRVRDKRFWSVRVSSDLRIIVHKDEGSLMLCYVDHHDRAYAWAERRKLETHPVTGAAQLVEIRESVRDLATPPPSPAGEEIKGKRPFAALAEDDLLSWGVPPEWLSDVRAATEDSFLDLTDHLPDEAAEALLEFAVGGKLPAKEVSEPCAEPLQHPDARRRFRVLATEEELKRALDYPWDRWITFLHPDQRSLVERSYSGPARVSGSAGTGKTIVALHRAVYLARRNAESRVLLATFSETLANALRNRLRRLIAGEPKLAERIEVHSMESLALRLCRSAMGTRTLADPELIRELLIKNAAGLLQTRFTLSFLEGEWGDVVDSWQLDSWEAYRDVLRLGRKTRLPEASRSLLWDVFLKAQEDLKQRGTLTLSGLYAALAADMTKRKHPPFDHVVVDEAQDISIPQLRFLSALGADEPNRLFFCGDTGQRIFRQAFSWKALGIDLRGRCRTLTVNYRTSRQILSCADKLLAPEVFDSDGNAEHRGNTVSLFNGVPPQIQEWADRAEEAAQVAVWLRVRLTQGFAPEELCICVRSEAELPRAHEAAVLSGIPFGVLDDRMETVAGKMCLCTMHLAKGLEFRAVAVMACDDGIAPLQSRINTMSDPSDLEEIYNSERRLLYVACTRARDCLLVTSAGLPSEFLEDLRT